MHAHGAEGILQKHCLVFHGRCGRWGQLGIVYSTSARHQGLGLFAWPRTKTSNEMEHFVTLTPLEVRGSRLKFSGAEKLQVHRRLTKIALQPMKVANSLRGKLLQQLCRPFVSKDLHAGINSSRILRSDGRGRYSQSGFFFKDLVDDIRGLTRFVYSMSTLQGNCSPFRQILNAPYT